MMLFLVFTTDIQSQDLIDKYPSIKLENDTFDNDDGVTWDNTFNLDWFLKHILIW